VIIEVLPLRTPYIRLYTKHSSGIDFNKTLTFRTNKNLIVIRIGETNFAICITHYIIYLSMKRLLWDWVAFFYYILFYVLVHFVILISVSSLVQKNY